jgi:glycosyltransferase involved in cell wall biosynthesis
VAELMARGAGAFYGACDLVLSPSPAADATLASMGVPAARVARWDRGVDTSRFDPRLRAPLALPGTVRVLYAGRISTEKGAELLAEAFLLAYARNRDLHLVLAGGGPEQELVRERVGDHASFLGWLEGEALARVYASADMLLFPSATDTFGQVILEAQASGLPVAAVAAGGPLTLIEHGVSGLLCAPEADSLADAVLQLAGRPLERKRLAQAGLACAQQRTWELALARLGMGYKRALSDARATEAARAA